MKNNITINELKKQGFYIDVYHGRTHIKNNIYGYEKPEDITKIISRHEVRKNENLSKNYTVSHFGGFTIIDITTPNGEKLIGKYNFNNRYFNRKIGIKAALGRALKK